jgi:hypothetical protein
LLDDGLRVRGTFSRGEKKQTYRARDTRIDKEKEKNSCVLSLATNKQLPYFVSCYTTFTLFLSHAIKVVLAYHKTHFASSRDGCS